MPVCVPHSLSARRDIAKLLAEISLVYGEVHMLLPCFCCYTGKKEANSKAAVS